MHCPSAEEITEQALALLPRGRAWPREEGTVLRQYWRAVAEVVAFLVARICALRLEFWCATHSETHDQWMIEYGLPDACDPFPDLCTKVAAIGGTRCEYYAAVAARAGWSIDCGVVDSDCGTPVGNFEVGCSEIGGEIGGATIIITVYLDDSPAYVAPATSGPFVGNMSVGRGLDCPPDITPLQCVLDRVVHAHIVIKYVTI